MAPLECFSSTYRSVVHSQCFLACVRHRAGKILFGQFYTIWKFFLLNLVLCHNYFNERKWSAKYLQKNLQVCLKIHSMNSVYCIFIYAAWWYAILVSSYKQRENKLTASHILGKSAIIIYIVGIYIRVYYNRKFMY